MKRSLFVLFIFAFISKTNAQEYKHGLGIQGNVGIFNYKYSSPYSSTEFFLSSIPGLIYKASVAFGLSDSTNLCISAYPFIGLSMNSQSGVYYSTEIPITAELYFGDIEEQCFFLGAGYSYGWYGNSGFRGGFINGPKLDIGGQFYFIGSVIGLKGGFVYGLNSTEVTNPSYVITNENKFAISIGGYLIF